MDRETEDFLKLLYPETGTKEEKQELLWKHMEYYTKLGETKFNKVMDMYQLRERFYEMKALASDMLTMGDDEVITNEEYHTMQYSIHDLEYALEREQEKAREEVVPGHIRKKPVTRDDKFGLMFACYISHNSVPKEELDQFLDLYDIRERYYEIMQEWKTIMRRGDNEVMTDKEYYKISEICQLVGRAYNKKSSRLLLN